MKLNNNSKASKNNACNAKESPVEQPVLGKGREAVILLCERLSKVYPSAADADIQDMAIDLHDIAHGCVAISNYVTELSVSRSKKKSAHLLTDIDDELFGHLQRFHFKSLRSSLKSLGKTQK